MGNKTIRAGKDANQAGRDVIQAVRELSITFPMPDGTAEPSIGKPGTYPTLVRLTQEPTEKAMYQALALLASTIRWAAHEMGRDEQQIIDELGKNFSVTPDV
jgi:hypothetical protein